MPMGIIMKNLTEAENKIFLKALEEKNAEYDDDVKLLKGAFSSPGYHTQYKGDTVHRTYDSAEYALALLDSAVYNERACEIIDKILSLQDADPNSDTFGIWSWFYEESLSEMSPPDWNWADFIGKELLQIICDYSGIIGAERAARVKAAIECACQSIIRRDVTISYTNIAVMDTFVTITAGEIFNNAEFFNYGKNKLKKISEHTLKNGLTEYNSPTYTTIVLKDISISAQYVKDKECLAYFREISDYAWKCVSEHWFCAISEWAGPYSRAYSSLLPEWLRSTLMYAVGMTDSPTGVGISFFRVNLKCPEQYKEYFTKQSEREIKFAFEQDIPSDKHVGSAPALSANCYIGEKFSLGSFFASMMWNQRRNLIAHWGEEGKARYLSLRCLNAGYDFCGGICHASQSKGNALIIVTFNPTGGNTHPNLDMIKDNTIETDDLRLSFEIGGCFNKSVPKWENNNISFSDNCLTFSIANHKTKLGDNEIYCETRENDGIISMDIVLYHGEKKRINLKESDGAFSVLTLEITPETLKSEGNAAAININGDTVHAKWKGLSGTAKL